MNFLKLLKNNIKLYAIVAITVLFVIIGWFAGLRELLNNLEMLTYDWRARIATDGGPLSRGFSRASKDIVLLSADDYTFRELAKYPELKVGRWPWPRKVWGDVVNFLSKGNPKAIVFDIKFESSEGYTKEQIESEKYFLDSLNKNKNQKIIFGMAMSSPLSNISDVKGISEKDKELALKEIYKMFNSHLNAKIPVKTDDSKLDEQKSKKLIENITFFEHSAIPEAYFENIDSAGVINIETDGETISRYNMPLYRMPRNGSFSYVPSLPLAAALAVLPLSETTPVSIEKDRVTFGKRIIPIDKKGRVLINWHGGALTYKNYSVADVLFAQAADSGKIIKNPPAQKITPHYFKDKIIVIGQTSAGTDILPTPMDMVYPGTEIIATAIDNYLNDTDNSNPLKRKFIHKASPLVNIFLTAVFCALLAFYSVKSQNNYFSALLSVLGMLLFILIAIVLFVHPDIRLWVNMTYPLIFMTFTIIGTYIYRINSEQKNRAVIKNLFGKFVSPQVLTKLLESPQDFSLESHKKDMTVLFSDIRGFTSLSETMPANELVAQINEYFEEMVDIVLKNNGTFDKFIGDALMAFYGDPLPMDDHATKAVKTAIEMVEKLKELNERWKNENKPEFNIGIGINTGEMLVGYIGSQKIVDYTVIGDNVNLASRLEGLNKEYKTNIIVSESTYEQVKDFVEAEEFGEVLVKGKQNQVKIYGLKGFKENCKEN
jgi:adenylate cyclase